MNRLLSSLALLALLSVVSVANAKKKEVEFRLRQDELFDNGFQGLELPKPDELRVSGHRHVYANLEFDEVWSGALRMLMQQGVLAHVSRDVGMIVCISPLPKVKGRATDTKPRTFLKSGAPSVVLIRPAASGGTKIVVDWLSDLYRRVDRPEVFAIAITEEARRSLAQEFILALEREAGAPGRWLSVMGGAEVRAKEVP